MNVPIHTYIRNSRINNREAGHNYVTQVSFGVILTHKEIINYTSYLHKYVNKNLKCLDTLLPITYRPALYEGI